MQFRRELAEAIMRGEKTATRRKLSDNPRSPWWREKCSYDVGQVFAVQPGRGVKGIGSARVTAVYKQRLGEMSEADALAEGFQAKNGLPAYSWFDATWQKINRKYDRTEEVWVVEFELAGAVA